METAIDAQVNVDELQRKKAARLQHETTKMSKHEKYARHEGRWTRFDPSD